MCATGLSGVRTGETITDPRNPVVLDSIRVPEAVVSVVLEPRTAHDRDRLGSALAKLLACDPSLRSHVDPESGQIVLSGMGKLHLEIQVAVLEGDHGVLVNTGLPSVAYRESIAREASVTYRHKKHDGGVGQFAVVALTLAPGERGSGFTFVDETKGGSVPREFVPAVERGARAAGLVVLEPVAVVEVHTGDVLGELAARRAQVRDVTPRVERGLVTVTARAPVATTFDFVPRLRALSHGRGTASVQPEGYDVAPGEIVRGLAER